MGWTDGDWYADYLCPEANGHRWCSGHDDLGEAEAAGVRTGEGGIDQREMGGPDMRIRTMSCAGMVRNQCRTMENNALGLYKIKHTKEHLSQISKCASARFEE